VNVFASADAAERLAAADEWLLRHHRGRVVVCGATLEAAGEALRRLAARAGAGAGWYRTTPARLAAAVAAPLLAARGLAPAGALTVQALCARVLHEADAVAGGRLAHIARRPGTARALARTLGELRLAGVDAPAELLPFGRAYEEALRGAGLADRADVFRWALEAAAGAHPLLGLPLLLLDIDAANPREAAFLGAVAARAPDALATAPAATLGLRAELQVFSAADEAREHVELVRRILFEAAAGTPFDRMAVLYRAPVAPPALAEALGRADVPACFLRGRPVPDPAGRAFLALLSCAEENLSARRFAEYLSLGEAAPASAAGAPPAARPPAERWAPADDELLAGEPEPGVESAPAPVAPSAWERLLGEATVLEGHERWPRRLAGLEARFALEARDAPNDNDDRAARARRRIDELRALRAFALPLIDDLAALPERAPWGDWLARLSVLATRALRRPERVLALLAELLPMAPVGPVGLAEVRLVLRRRLGDISVPPDGPRAGRVLVAPIDAVRGLAFDVVFLPGLAEKQFPPKIAEDPLLPDARRPPGLARQADRAAAERALLHLATGAAGRRLFASYARLDDGRPRVPSIYLQELCAAAEGRVPGVKELKERAEHAGAAGGEPIDAAEYDLRAVASAGGGAARYLLSASPHLARSLRARARRWHGAWHSVDGMVRPSDAARAVLGRHGLAARSYSPTALQRFAACPYQFFLQAVLRLAPREEPERLDEMDPLTRGSLVHDVLWAYLDELGAAGLLPVGDAGDAAVRLDRVLDETAARYRDDLAPAVERVWEDGVAAIRADLHEWLARLVAERTWQPWRFELAFGIDPRDPDSRPDPAPLDCGIRLRGSIDLVERDASGALRATDYKTGKVRAPRGAVIVGGEMLQPVLYALALEKIYPGATVRGARLHHITRAAAFETVDVPLDAAARAAADRVAATVGGALDQGFLPAAPRSGACRFCDYRPICGPHEEARVARKPQAALARLATLRRQR
jgi:RecB family exonuclease